MKTHLILIGWVILCSHLVWAQAPDLNTGAPITHPGPTLGLEQTQTKACTLIVSLAGELLANRQLPDFVSQEGSLSPLDIDVVGVWYKTNQASEVYCYALKPKTGQRVKKVIQIQMNTVVSAEGDTYSTYSIQLLRGRWVNKMLNNLELLDANTTETVNALFDNLDQCQSFLIVKESASYATLTCRSVTITKISPNITEYAVSATKRSRHGTLMGYADLTIRKLCKNGELQSYEIQMDK